MLFFAWIFNVLTASLPDIASTVATPPSGFRLSGEITLGQIGVIISVVWTAAKIYFPLLNRVKALEDSNGRRDRTLDIISTTQTTHGGMLQRVIGQLEGEDKVRAIPRPQMDLRG